MRGRGLRHALVAVLLVGAACSGGAETAAPSPPAPFRPADPLRSIARQEGTVGVIVELAVPKTADGTWDGKKIAAAQRKLLKDLGDGATVSARYETTPQLALDLTPAALERLRASPLVLGIHLNQTDEATE